MLQPLTSIRLNMFYVTMALTMVLAMMPMLIIVFLQRVDGTLT